MQFKNFITSPRETSFTEPKKFSYYKKGVRVKFPKKGPPLRVQILPAYNPDRPSDPQGSVPCLVGGQPTAWFGMVQAAKFVGHGDWKSTLPILSLASFEGREPCPYLQFLHYCKNSPDWKYLVTKTGHFGSPDYQDAVLKPVKSILLLNVVDADNPGNGVQLGEFSYSVANNLLNVETGIVFQKNLQIDSYPDAASLLANDPMLAYSNGDITDPGKAPIFVVELPPVKAGQFGSGYTARIEIVKDRVSRRVASDYELAERYHLDDPESFLNIPTGQDIVDELVTLLKGHKNAQGIDETCAIKEALGDKYRVDTVSSPGTSSTVASGFSLPPEEPAFRQPQGFAPNPAQAAQAAQASQPAPAVASAQDAGAAVTDHAFMPASSGARMAIPGELSSGDQAALAASLAERMRAQMGMRRS